MASLDHLRRQLAADLLDVGAVTLSPEAPFTWASGMRSPVYCDNRQTLAHPRVRRRIVDGFAEVLKREGDAPTLIAGTATAGIPHATLLAERLALPIAYVRSEAKGHGTENRIEGADPAGEQVIVIEDLVSTGQSAHSAARVLEETGAEVGGVLAIFSYELDAARDTFADAPWPLHVLTGFSALLGVAEDDDRLSSEQLTVLRRWHRNPEKWAEKEEGEREQKETMEAA